MKKYKVRPLVANGIIYYPRIEDGESMSYENPETIDPQDLPTGRVSVEPTLTLADMVRDFLGEYSTARSKFPLEYLQVMQSLSLVNPNVSQMVGNVVELGNTGHSIFIEDTDPRQEAQILDVLDQFSLTGFSRFGGLEGYVNSAFGQIARSGPVSVEWIVKDDLSGLEGAVFVPVESIRFVLDPELNRYLPYQKVDNLEVRGGMIPLNTYTYQYLPLHVLDNSPYAIPPILPAMEAIMIEREVMKNFKFIAKKVGLLGFLSFLMKAPMTKAGESPEQYQARCRKVLADAAEDIKHNYRDGIALGFMESMQVTHTSVMGSAQGASDMLKEIELQIFSGLKADPALHGRTYSTTETYAGVVYEKMLAQLSNYRRLVKSTLEYAYKLELNLRGLTYGSLSVEFNPSKSLKPDLDANTYLVKVNTLSKLYADGIISQERYAQEAGYDTPDQPGPRNPFGDAAPQAPASSQQNRLKLVYSRDEGRYKRAPRPQPLFHVPSSYKDVTDEESVLQELESDAVLERLRTEFNYGCDCRHSTEELANSASSIQKLNAFIIKYFRMVYPSMKNARIKAVRAVEGFLKKYKNLDQIDSEQFSNEVYDVLSSEFGDAFDNSPIKDKVRSQTKVMYSYFRLQDADPFGGTFPIKPNFDLQDQRAINFIRNSDEFYFGRYVTDPQTKAALKTWLQEDYLKSGRSIRDPGEIEKFRERFGDRVAKEDYKVLRVVETSASRAKNWGNIMTINEARGRTIQIAGPNNDNVICDWCRAMMNPPKEFKVAPVVDHVKEVMANKPEDLPRLSPFLPGRFSPAAAKDASEGQLLAQGIALPPFHPHCRHRHIVKDFEND